VRPLLLGFGDSLFADSSKFLEALLDFLGVSFRS
jgi:hypothetical protein